MSFAEFIRANLERILDEWVRFAQEISSASRFESTNLRDHAGGILKAIAADLEQAQSPNQQDQKAKGRAPSSLTETEAAMHGAARLSEGFSIIDAMAEFRALRASVLRLWSERSPATRHENDDEMTRFNEAIDQVLTESLVRYAADRERHTRLFDALRSSSPDLNFIVEPNGELLYANQAFAALYETGPALLSGTNLYLLCESVAADLQLHVRGVAQTKATYRGEMLYKLRDGRELAYEYLLVPVIDTRGNVEAVAGSARDITERKATEERIRRSANYDSLTDLPNRNLFLDRLDHEVRHAARTGLPLALLFIDLDGFKEVNDRLGHAAGDELLRQAARRISACVRDTDTVARLGGDEFTVILTDVTEAAHIDVLTQEILDALNRPFALMGQEARISGSIGITLSPQDGVSPDTLVRNADLAMYVAKNAGRNRYRFFMGPAPRRP